jgi:diguanylate cyclase (GGDEF)-like protein
VSATHPSEPATAGDGSTIPRDSLLAVIDDNVDGMLVIDRSGVIMLANRAAENLLGRPVTSLVGTPFGAPLTLEKATELDLVAAGRGRTAEMRVVMIDWHGDRAFLASLRDVTDRKRAETVLSRVGAQHAAIAMLGKAAVSGLAPEALMAETAKHVRRVLRTDFAGVLAVSPEGGELRLVASEWSTPPSDPVDREPPADSQPRYTIDADETVVMDNAGGETRFAAWPPEFASAVTVLISDNEECFGVIQAASLTPRRLALNEITFMQSVGKLLAAAVARFRAEGQVRHQAFHDALTGLSTRGLFLDRLSRTMARSRRNSTGLAVLFADLDGFKQVNDSLGHHAGDEVLVGVAQRLTSILRSSDALARLGGDEFLILLDEVESDEELSRAVARIREAITDTPFVVEGQPLALDLTIGVVRADESHGSPEDLIRDADSAMYRAKQLGRGGHAVFDRAMRDDAHERGRVEHELHAALDAGQLQLFYQPIVSLVDGRIVELEALLRWQHPERGLLAAPAFLPLAIESRLILPIGKWALQEACRAAAAWRTSQDDPDAPGVNMNLSASELAQPDLRNLLGDVIEQAGAPVRLQLELNESALTRDPALAAKLSDFRRNLGVRVVLEDFGIGPSSLASLTRFEIAELKIDRSLVRKLAHGHDMPIVAAIIEMAHALDILVVAEGIETEEQATEARRLGCDRGQGFFLGPPRPLEPIATLLTQATVLPALPDLPRPHLIAGDNESPPAKRASIPPKATTRPRP